MKSLIILILFYTILVFPQGNYEAKISILRIYWQHHNEWGAILQGDLYLDDNLLIPNVDYDPSINTYTWKRLENGVFVDKSYENYYLHTDGHPNQVWTWKVQISGEGFSTDDSDPIDVVKYGEIATVHNVNAFKDDGSSANGNVWIRIWAEYSWYDIQPAPYHPFFLTNDDYNILKDSVVSLSGERFHSWETINPNAIYYNNHANIYVGYGLNDINIYHKTHHNVTFNLIGDVPNLKFSLTDPWRVKSTPPYYQYPYYRSLGLEAIPEEIENGIYGGIIFNQGYPNWTPPYYTISIPQNIIAGNQIHEIWLQNWSLNHAQLEWPNELESPIVFTDHGAVSVTAYIKGQGLSDDENAYSSNSQRKFVKSDDGYLHNVYESMGHVWYELSTDNGQSWILQNNKQPLDNGGGENPSIDWVNINNGYKRYVVIVFQQNEVGTGFPYSIQAEVFGGFGLNPFLYPKLQTQTIYNSGYQYSHAEATPVVSIYPATNSAGLSIIWHTNEGLNFQYAGLGLDNPPLNLINPSVLINGTDLHSINPSLSTDKTNNPGIFHLVFEDNNTIKYSTVNASGQVSLQTISNGCGYANYYSPSILVMETDNVARVCWVGHRYFCNPIPGGQGDCIGIHQYKVIFRGLW